MRTYDDLYKDLAQCSIGEIDDRSIDTKLRAFQAFPHAWDFIKYDLSEPFNSSKTGQMDRLSYFLEVANPETCPDGFKISSRDINRLTTQHFNNLQSLTDYECDFVNEVYGVPSWEAVQDLWRCTYLKKISFDWNLDIQPTSYPWKYPEDMIQSSSVPFSGITELGLRKGFKQQLTQAVFPPKLMRLKISKELTVEDWSIIMSKASIQVVDLDDYETIIDSLSHLPESYSGSPTILICEKKLSDESFDKVLQTVKKYLTVKESLHEMIRYHKKKFDTMIMRIS